MTHKQFIRRTIKIFQDPEMTLVLGTAVALGVVYACVAPWFCCKSDKPEDESQGQCNQETDSEISSANQTLTSTHIRVVGLRGVNFVSIKLPERRSVSTTTDHSSEAPSRTRSSIQQSENVEIVKSPVITHPDLTQKSTIPGINISSALTDTTTYRPLYEEIRSCNNENQNFRCRKLSQSNIRRPPRDQAPNVQKSRNTCSKNQNLLPPSGASHKRQHKSRCNLNVNEIAPANDFIDCQNSRSGLAIPEIVERTSLSQQQTQHSLYPDVNVIVGTNNLSTSFASNSEIRQNLRDTVEKSDLIAKCSAENNKKMVSHSSSVDDFSSTVEDIRNVSGKSCNISVVSNFFKKKCKKLWINANKSHNKNRLKAKCTIASGNENNPTGHSTPIEKSTYSSEVQGHIQNFVPQRILCGFTPNLYATQPITMLTTSSNINSEMELTKLRSPPCRCNVVGFDDEPLDLSTKSRVNQTNSEPGKDGNNNCVSETSCMSSFKKRTNSIFTKTFKNKLHSKKKVEVFQKKMNFTF